MIDLIWIRVVSPEDIAAALSLPTLTVTDALQHQFKGVRHEVTGVTRTHTMYEVDEIEDWAVDLFPREAHDAAFSRLAAKAIKIARKIEQ